MKPGVGARAPWYFHADADYWDGDPLLTISHVTTLFESPEFLRDEYSIGQLDQGIWYLNGIGQPYMLSLLDPEVPWTLRERGLRSILTFFERFFARSCTEQLSHVLWHTTIPLNGACYMWWDVFPSWGQPEDASRAAEDRVLLSVLRDILRLPSVACQESALHGLGHWQMNYPLQVAAIIDAFLNADLQMTDQLRAYAVSASLGEIQ